METQTIILEQHHSSIRNFHGDLGRSSGHQAGYDQNIATRDRMNSFFAADGTLATNDLGFNGTDVGSNTVVPNGSNWADSTSPASVGAALSAARTALDTTSAVNQTALQARSLF